MLDPLTGQAVVAAVGLIALTHLAFYDPTNREFSMGRKNWIDCVCEALFLVGLLGLVLSLATVRW